MVLQTALLRRNGVTSANVLRSFDIARRALASPHTSSFRTIPALPHFTPPATFDSLKLHPKVSHALSAIGIHSPTKIQTLAIPEILSGQNTLLAAETGAGKTLAYLVPLLSALKNCQPNNSLINLPPSRPQLLVLLPTRELAAQVSRVAKSLSHVIKLRIRTYTSAESPGVIRRLKDAPYDVLITTPGGFATLRDRKAAYLSAIRTVVLDEADELLADRAGFGDQLSGLLTTLRSRKAQHVYVAATIPGGLEQVLNDWHPQLSTFRGEKLHRVADTGLVRVNFIRVNGPDEAKMIKVVEIVRAAVERKDGKVLVFCDGAERREGVVERLVRRRVDAVHLSGARSSEERERSWDRFKEGGVVGVCSSAFGRGIDDNLIKNVVLMDVPMTGGEYVHRVGRIRERGRVYVLVGRREQAIAEALFLGHVNGESLNSVRAGMAWKEYTNAKRDRVGTDRNARRARNKGEARWVDERVKAFGKLRGRQGRRRQGWRSHIR